MRANRAARLRRVDEPRNEAQMMLLTAFVLVIGFVALTAMVARVSQLPEDTRQSTDRPIYTEAEAVALGVQEMMQRVHDLTAPADEDDPRVLAGTSTYPGLLAAEMATAAKHLERLESARGFRLKFQQYPTCDGDLATDGVQAGSPANIVARFSLNDVNTRIEFATSFPVPDAPDGGIDLNGDPTVYSCPSP